MMPPGSFEWLFLILSTCIAASSSGFSAFSSGLPSAFVSLSRSASHKSVCFSDPGKDHRAASSLEQAEGFFDVSIIDSYLQLFCFFPLSPPPERSKPLRWPPPPLLPPEKPRSFCGLASLTLISRSKTFVPFSVALPVVVQVVEPSCVSPLALVAETQ